MNTSDSELWHSLHIAAPHELGIGQARKRLSRLVSSALNGKTYVVRDPSRRSNEAVVIISLSQLLAIAASMRTPALTGADVLALLPFRNGFALGEIQLAPLPHPGLPQLLSDSLKSKL